MFSFFRAEEAVLQLYGKLPLAKDYLRIGCAQGGGKRLREWMDGEFSGMLGDRTPSLPGGGMLFVVGDGWDTSVQGLLIPSSDAGGLRPFPITLFVERRKKRVAEELEAGLGPTHAIWTDLEAYYSAHKNYGDGHALLTALRGKRVRVEGIEASRCEPIDFESWVRALWDDGERGLERCMNDLQTLGARDRDGALRLPLVANRALVTQAHGWLRLVVHMGLVPQDSLPTLFLSRAESGEHDEGEQPFLTVFRRAPGRGDARWLARPSQRLGPGDQVEAGRLARAEGGPAHENVPPLGDSLRGAVISFRGRAGRN